MDSTKMIRNTTSLASVTIAFASMLAVSGAQAADLESGRKKAEEVCAACHGKDGNTGVDPSYPKLAGQHADYLYHALRAYKSETRKNPIMGALAKPLTNAEMRNLAAYYASLPGQLSHKR